MKKFLWLFSSVLLLSLAIFSAGCGDDSTTDDLPPVVSVQSGPTPESLLKGDRVSVTVSATKGTKALKSVTIYEGSTIINATDYDLNFDGAAFNNPAVLINPSDSYTWDIDFKVNADAGDVTYTVKVEDEGGLSDEASFTVTVEAPLTATIEGVDINLWNQAGPAGKGAIDLDNGNSTGTSDLTAELRDMGIDSLAGSGDNWRRRIGGINGTEVRYVGNTSSSAEFASVASKEAIVAAFDGGDDLITASTIATDHLDVWGNFKVSEVVSQGDVFAIYKSSSNTYYLVVVNNVVETTNLGDNTDHYNVSIKY